MSIYHIEANGTDMGEYHAFSMKNALDMYACDADYDGYADLVAEIGDDPAVIVKRIDTDALCAAIERATGNTVFADAYGEGVARVNNESIATWGELAAMIDKHITDFATQ